MGNSGYELQAVDSQFDQFVFLGSRGWLCPLQGPPKEAKSLSSESIPHGETPALTNWYN